MKRGWIAALLLALTACGGGSSDSDSSGTADGPHDRAAAIESAVSAVTKVEDLTEDTDSNDLLGRPNGYDAATVIYDSRASCADGPGVDCGAVIERWPSEDDAKKRADHIQSILKDSPILGSEYDYVDGALILRVSGTLDPSEVQEYEAAFSG